MSEPAAAAALERRPAPPGGLVAVLERRGRFLVAEPLFAPRGDGDGRRGGGRDPRQQRIVVDPHTRRGGQRLGGGELVLVVVASRTRVQGRSRGGPARVERVIGRPDVARDVIEGLLLDRGMQRAFDAPVEREARAARDEVFEPERERAVSGGSRRDLRALQTFTIDPVSARDFDDAISAQRLDGDAIRVWVHIADVAAHVPEGSLVDREAHRRATSVYVPGTVEPMLPQALSDDACSLVPGRERLAVTVEMEIHGVAGAEGAAVRRSSFYRSLIRSDERLDYDRVDAIFAGAERAADPWAGPLADARAAAAGLARARERHGALVVDSPEPEFGFDAHGHVVDVRTSVQTESHRLIEHLMIAANEAVAGLLAQRQVPCLYRVHERPEPERVRRLIDQLASLDVPTPPAPELISPSQAAELVGEVSRLVDGHVRRTGRGRLALSGLVLRALARAHYSPTNVGHAGLHSACYCHFTSPIRRYPDLVCHRALLSVLGEHEQAPRAGGLAELGAWTSDRERAAMALERDADDVARCFALERELFASGWDGTFAGEVTGLVGGGAFIAFASSRDGDAALPYQGMLPVRRLGGPEQEWWEPNEQGTIMVGTRAGGALRLGDPIAVRVHGVDAPRGRIDLDRGSVDDISRA